LKSEWDGSFKWWMIVRLLESNIRYRHSSIR
jgi:hypothetical protein